MSNAAEHMARIADMVVVLRARQAEVAKAEHDLDVAKSNLRTVEEEDFPELMRECELKEVTLEDGTKLKLVDDVRCGISEERRPLAHKWLRDNGFGGIIKTALVMAFGKEDEKKVAAATKLLITKFGRAPEFKEAVHPQTLKSFVKEQAEKGKMPPVETFGITQFTKVVAKDPKQ